MGNTESSSSEAKLSSKNAVFKCHDPDDDEGGFLNAQQRKAAEVGCRQALNRFQPTRKSFDYNRLGDCNQSSSSLPHNGDNVENLKRINSLPTAKIKTNKKNFTSSMSSKRGENGKVAAAGFTTKKASVQGFDMFRHHLGQINCNIELFRELENDLLSLNRKLVDIKQTRQSCLEKLHTLNIEIRQAADISIAENQRKHRIKMNDLALRIIGTYLQRVDHLLRVDDEPFLLDVQSIASNAATADVKSCMRLEQSSQLEKSIDDNSHSLITKVGSSPQEAEQSPCTKRQQIKNAYNHLVQSIMPQLYGQRFDHKDESTYLSLRHNLSQLREQVQSINTIDEQRLLDAKRIFMSEIDSYLRTINEMVRCEKQNNCANCQI